MSSTGVAWLAASAIAVLALQAAFRGRRELRRWLGRDPFARRRALRAAALALAGAVLATAWLRAAALPPRLSGAGLDLVLALDVSQSMNVRDSAPSRLRRAVRLAERVARETGGVRLSLVFFAADAYVALPLTQDADAVLAYLGAVDTELVSALGTDLGRALDASVRAFDPRSERPREILLFSDGEDGGRGLEDALGRARAAGARIVAVGFGTPEGGEVLGRGGEVLRDRDDEVVHSRRSDTVLRRVAAVTDGSYYREPEDAPDPSQLLVAPRAPSSDEAGAPDAIALLLAAAFALVGGELLLSTASRRPAARGGQARQPKPADPRALGQRPASAVAAAALIALSLLGLFPWDLEDQAERLLAEGSAREALATYRRLERQRAPSARSLIGTGNALYRLGMKEQAVASYLDVLRRFGADDPDARFTASFNMGTVLLSQQRWDEARDALWKSLLERPESLEAKFNYEWALAHSEPEEDYEIPPLPEPETEPQPAPSSSRPDPSGGDRDRRRAREQLSQEEAERWLRSLEEAPGEPLRREIAGSTQSGTGRGERRQTW